MLINQNNEQITTQGVILHLLICHLRVFSEKKFFTLFYWRHKLKSSYALEVFLKNKR